MKRHKIRIKIEIVECEEEVQSKPTKIDDGEFELVMSEKQSVSIDDCEAMILRANYPAIRDALSQHLSEISKKNKRSGN